MRVYRAISIVCNETTIERQTAEVTYLFVARVIAPTIAIPPHAHEQEEQADEGDRTGDRYSCAEGQTSARNIIEACICSPMASFWDRPD